MAGTATGQSSFSSNGATTYFDLTRATGDRAEINDALFFQNKPDSSSGTGLIQAIVRVQDPGGGDGLENGYNSSARPVSYEENTSPNFTTSLLLSEVPIVTIDGTQYYEFRLDINQLNSSSLLSLDEVKVYTSAVADGEATGLITGSWFTSNAHQVYDMDGAGNTSVLLDAGLSSGSGSSDMFFYVPLANFGAVDPDDTYVTLYSEFGAAGTLDSGDGLTPLDDPANTALGDDGSDTGDVATAVYGGYLANDGFEEWSVSKQTGGNITGYKFDDANGNGQWDVGEVALGGWSFDYTITYDEGKGKNIQHVVVDGTVTTSDGAHDVDGDGIIDPVGYYSIAVPVSSDKNETYTITITEHSQAGWTNTYDGDATANGTTTFTFSGSNLTTTGSPAISGAFGATHVMNFGNFETFTLSGHKYTDVTGNGISSDDTGLGGVTIFVDMTGNGLSADDPQTTTSDGSTDANHDGVINAADVGYWELTGLTAADAGKEVKEVTPTGYVQTVGQVGTVTDTNYIVTGTSGTDQGNLDFANFETFTLSGHKYTDVTGNGITSDDTGLGGVKIFVDLTGNGLSADDPQTTTSDGSTDANHDGVINAADVGYWELTGLTAADAGKEVKEVTPTGYVQTVGQVGTVTDTNYIVTGTSGTDQGNLDFANFETFTISGTKYEDVNGNGTVDSGDNGLAGWVVFIDADNNDQIAGDTNNNGVLDLGETWTEKYAITDSSGNWSISGLDASYDNLPVKEFIKDGWVQTLSPSGTIDATSGNDQTGMDFANFLPNPDISITKYVKTDVSGAFVDANDPDGPLASASTTVDFKVVVSNTGNEALSGISISDTVDDNGVETNTPIDYNLVGAHIDINNDGTIDGLWSDYDQNMDGTLDDADGNFLTDDDFVLGVGQSLAVYYSLDSALGQHENTAAVEAVSAISNATVLGDDDANYYVLESEECVGVRTPGFWANTKWTTFWDGADNNQPKQAGTPGFAAGELLYSVDSDGNGVVNPMDKNGDGFVNALAGDKVNDGKPLDPDVGLLIGDYNMNGITDAGEDTIFISIADARKLINASSKQLVDGKTSDGIYMLGRDVVAAWLNYLANNPDGDTGNCIGTVDPNDGTNTPREYLDAAIDWLQQFASTGNADDTASTTDTNLNTSFHDGDAWARFEFDTRVAPSSGAWQNPFTTGEVIPVSAAAMHSALDGYNNTGKIGAIEYCCDADSPLVLNVLSQVHESLL